MLNGKKIVVIMPAYNAAKTLEKTFIEIPLDIVDETILVDDCSSDGTPELARRIGIHYVIEHDENAGYGANQKTCYDKALSIGADIVIMVHPDYQYTPKLIRAMSSLIAEDLFDCVLASRILGNGALNGGMPIIKYLANRFLTLFQNLLLNHKLSEYHTGYRAFSKDLLESINYSDFSDDFIFDNQMIIQIINSKYRVGEVTCPTKYFEEASSIGGWSLYKYGLEVIFETLKNTIKRF